MKNKPNPKMRRIKIKNRTKAQFPKPVTGTCSAATSAILRPPFKNLFFLNKEQAKREDEKN
jgi:hypothetical protein